MKRKRNPFRPVTPRHTVVGRYSRMAIPSYHVRVLYRRKSKYDTNGLPRKK